MLYNGYYETVWEKLWSCTWIKCKTVLFELNTFAVHWILVSLKKKKKSYFLPTLAFFFKGVTVNTTIFFFGLIENVNVEDCDCSAGVYILAVTGKVLAENYCQ